jgi:hypothetical protein
MLFCKNRQTCGPLVLHQRFGVPCFRICQNVAGTCDTQILDTLMASNFAKWIEFCLGRSAPVDADMIIAYKIADDRMTYFACRHQKGMPTLPGFAPHRLGGNGGFACTRWSNQDNETRIEVGNDIGSRGLFGRELAV